MPDLSNFGLKENYQNKKVKNARIINSTLSFVIAFVAFNFLLDFCEFIIAIIGGAHPRWFYWGLKMSSSDEVNLGNFAFLLGPLLSLGIGIFAFYIFKKNTKKRSFKDIFYIWFGVVGIAAFLSQLVYLNFSYEEEFGVLYRRFHLSDNFLVISNLFFVITTLLLGLLTSGFVMQLTNSKRNLLGGHKRRAFIIGNGLYPLILGSVICFFFYLPQTTTFKIVFLINILLIITISIFFSSSSIHRKVKFYRYPSSEKIFIIPIIVALLIYFFFHVAFHRGIKF